MAEVIEDYFGDGSQWGVSIRYLKEDQRLGTAGALGLLPNPDTIASPIIVMNGDLLTKVNFEHLLSFHEAQHAIGTMCVREYEYQVPYGVVNLDQHSILKIEEKPTQKFFVNAGIYSINAGILRLIPKQTYFDMPTLFEMLISNRQKTAAFPIREYWLDIGHTADFERANGEYRDIFL